MKRIGISLVLLTVVSILSSCSSDPSYNGDAGDGPSWRDDPYIYGKSEVPVAGAPGAGMAKLVFVRPKAAAPGEKVANIYVGDRYLTSLMAGAYVVHLACAGPVSLSAVFDDASLKHEGKYKADRTIDLEAGKTYYLQVDNRETRGATEIEEVAASAYDLSGYKVQTHPVSRVPKSCTPAQAEVLEPASPAAALAAGAYAGKGSARICDAAAAGAAPVRKASKSLDAASVAELRCAIEAWREDWVSGSFAAYRRNYDQDDPKAVAQRKGWEDLRERRLRNRNIAIDIGAITLTRKGPVVISEFPQAYRSVEYRDKGTKHLTWSKGADGWKIVSEGFSHSR